MNKLNLFGGNEKSSKALFESTKSKAINILPAAPIQDENGDLTFSYNGKTYTVNVNSEEDRNSFAEDFNKENGKKFSWFKERAGLQHYVFYDTEMFRVSIRDLRYCHENGLTPCMPFNATSCRHMFASCKLPDNIDFSSFNTENIVTHG